MFHIKLIMGVLCFGVVRRTQGECSGIGGRRWLEIFLLICGAVDSLISVIMGAKNYPVQAVLKRMFAELSDPVRFYTGTKF